MRHAHRARERAARARRTTRAVRRAQIVGDFKEAGRFIGKEDFAVSRSGLSLRIRGNPQEDPQSLVAGFDQTVELPIDSDVAGLSADFRACALRVTVPRRKEARACPGQPGGGSGRVDVACGRDTWRAFCADMRARVYQLPAELVEALKAMSPEELQELAEAQAKIRDGGREVDGPPAAKADEPDC